MSSILSAYLNSHESAHRNAIMHSILSAKLCTHKSAYRSAFIRTIRRSYMGSQ